MKKLMVFIVIIALLGLVMGDAMAARPEMPKLGKIYGTGIYGTNVGDHLSGFVTGNTSGQTQFGCSEMTLYGNDYFNLGWSVFVPNGATNIAAGTFVDITDYVSSTGTFTVASAGANWANGDPFMLVYIGPAAVNELKNAGAICFPGIVTTGADADTFYVEAFIGIGNDRFNDCYYCEITRATDGLAPQSEIRDVTDIVSSTGQIVVDPAFSVNTTAGDIITIWHEAAIRERLPGNQVYRGNATAVGTYGVTTPPDSLYLTNLKGFGDDHFVHGDYWIYVVETTDGAAPVGQFLRLSKYTSNTGLFVAAATSYFTAEITDNDQIQILHSSEVAKIRGDLSTGLKIRAHRNGASTTHTILDELIDYPDSSFKAGFWMKVIYDHAGAGAPPEGETVKIIKYKASTGVVVSASALTTAIGAGDIVLLYHDPTEGVAWYTERVYTSDPATVPQNANDTLFTIYGMAEIVEVIGEVTTVIGGGAGNAKLIIDNGGTETDICSVLDINTDAVGTFMTITGTFANAMVNNPVKACIPGAQVGAIRLAPGTNYLMLHDAAAGATGAIQWSIRVEPLEEDVRVISHDE